MKKRLAFLLFSLVLVCSVLALPARAVIFPFWESGDWTLGREDTMSYVNWISRYNGTAKTVTIPTNVGGHNVDRVYYNAFQGNTTMKTLIVPDGVFLGGLSGCDVETVKLGNDSNVAEGAFGNCKKLKTINIPTSWEWIPDQLFFGCESLTSLVLPDNITAIGPEAFAECTGLTSITLPKKLETIDESAFLGCTSLKTITIPKSVTAIHETAFAYCTGLEKIVVEEGNPHYSTDAQGNLYDNYEGVKTLVWAAAKDAGVEYKIAEDIQRIGDAAFLGVEGLTAIVIPKNVTEVGYYSFADCVDLQEVLLEGYVDFGPQAFGNVTADIYCPGDTGEWTESNVGAFGGNLTWYGYCTGIHLSTEGATLVESTCTMEGTGQSVCQLCGDVYTYSLPLAEHAFGEPAVITESTCTVPGQGSFTCTVCGHAENRELPLKEHEMSPPQSNGSGYHTSKCANCTWSSMVVCNYIQTQVIKPSTCAEYGQALLVCQTCGDTKYGTPPLEPHDVEGVDATPSEGNNSMHIQLCRQCGTAVESWCSWEETGIDVTPTAPGKIIRECTLCGNHHEEIKQDIYRISGSNRFETAFLIADQMKASLGVEKFDAIIVASGTNFADALSGSYLAAVKNAPILLSFNEEYNNQAKTYIRSNLKEGGTVYILGGTGAVPADIEEGLEGFTVKRLAGDNRFDTNLAILEEAGVGDKPVLVCTGLSFADSLSASASELPILLVWNDLTDGQKALLEGLGGDNQLYVIGGEGAVSTGMEAQVAAYGEVKRIGGANRFETSVMIAEEFFDAPKSVLLAYAWNYPDGLCGGPLAAVLNVPLILTMENYSTSADAYAEKTAIQGGAVLGGENLIPDYVVREILNIY